jgi:hypothetical protein
LGEDHADFRGAFVVSSHHDAFLAELKPDRDWELRRANSL